MFDQALITELLIAYHVPAVFVGSFLLGETVLITTGYLMEQLRWSIPVVFLVALLGTVLADVMWLLGARLALSTQWVESYKEKHADVITHLERLTGTKPFIALLFVKFLYGTRILTIFYLSWRKVSLATFILYDTIGTMLWLVAVLGIGVLAAKGVATIIPTFNTIQVALLVILIALGISRMITVWVKRKLLRQS